MTTSANPNNTSGRVNSSVKALNFPLNETLALGTRLHFVTYSRAAPFNEPSEDTSVIISLPLPLSLPDNSNIKAGTVDLGSFGMVDMSRLAKEYDGLNIEMFKDAWDTGQSYVTEQVKRMGEHLKTSGLKALALSPIVPDGNMRTTAQLTAGVVNNPHTTLLFEGVNLKSYNLTWRFSARSQADSDMLNDIVNTVKMRAHPEEAFRGYALDYPDLVYVQFTGGAEKYLPRYHKSMINNIQLNFSGGNGLSFYKSGAPTEVELSISLTEVRIVTRNELRRDLGEE